MIEASILIIEDDLSNLKLITTYLINRGYKISSAMTAEEGLKMINKEHPHLILMDLKLPNMDGLQLTKIIKTNPETKNIVVINKI